MNDAELLKELNFNLTCNQTPHIEGGHIVIDIFRGSTIRGNRHKVSSLRFSRSEILTALNHDSVSEFVSDAESKLNIPIVSYREW